MRKGKILNGLIMLLTFLVILAGSAALYLFFSRETYIVTFNLNGADSVDVQSLECTSYLNGCIVTIPNVARKNGKAEGFNYGTNDTIARFEPGDKVLLTDDMSLYAVSYLENTVKIDSSGIDFIEQNEVSCGIYNNDKACQVTLPRFNKIGYQNIGYSTSSKNKSVAEVEYLMAEEYTITSNVTIYPKTELYSSKSAYSTNYLGLMHGNFIEVDKAASSNISSTFKNYLDEINQYAPYLFVNIKINILGETQFNKIWQEPGLLGVTYHLVKNSPTKLETIDVLYDYSNFSRSELNDENYHTVVHEMAHSWDFYYPYGLKRVIPKEINSSNEKIHESDKYFDEYYKAHLSQHQDIVDLYDKYKAMSTARRPLSEYAYTMREEFFAEAVSYYYLHFLVPTGKYARANYPDELKKVIEKYICVATHDYHNKGCY